MYIDVYMSVSSFRYLRVEMDKQFHTSHFSTMFQYMYKVTELKKMAPHTS